MNTHQRCLCVSAIAAICVAAFTVADEPKLKPLPKFLRSPRLAERYLRTRDIEEILKFERAEPVCLQLLSREGVDRKYRLEAISKLAELRNTNSVEELLTAIKGVDTSKTPELRNELARLLPSLPQPALAENRKSIEPLLNTDAPIQQAAYAGIIEADQSIEKVWSDKLSPNLILAFKQLQSAATRKAAYKVTLPLLGSDVESSVQQAAVQSITYLDGDMKPAFEAIAKLIQSGKNTPECIAAIRRIPHDAWGSNLGSVAEPIQKYAASLSIADRTSGDGAAAIALLGDMARVSKSPELETAVRKLQVQSFTVTALKEKMLYDEPVLIVEAGRAVQIVFKNDDIMPHNLVVGTEPEARVELGLLADDMQGDPEAAKRNYLPDSDLVMHASKMIQPDTSDTIEFVAPAAGVYPFVCTFPGHWSKMYGAIKVVEDASEYLAANNPLPTADDLLGIRKVEWKYDELAAALSSDEYTKGRSLENGKKLFRRASCYSCHKVKGEGGVIGPDLTEITKKYKTPAEVLTHIMQPSKEIDPKFASLTIIDDDGLTHQGVVVERTDEQVVLKKNPLEDCEPIVIRLDEIDEEFASKVSPMPENLLNTIVEKSDVYDLLEYVMRGGL